MFALPGQTIIGRRGRRVVVGGGSAVFAWANSEAQAWYNASVAAGATDTASNAQKSAYDTFVGAMKSSGFWAKQDAVLLVAAWHPVASRVDMKTAALRATATNATFYPNRGWYLDGATSVYDTGFMPSTGVNFQQNNASITYGGRSADRSGSLAVSMPVSTISAGLLPRNNSDKVVTRVNSTASTTSTPSVTTGFNLVTGNRTASNVEAQYVDGALFHTGSATSSAPSANSVVVGRSNTAYVETQPIFIAFGAALTAGEASAINTAYKALISALGITPAGYSAAAGEPITLPVIARKTIPDGATGAAGKGIYSTGYDGNLDGTQRWGGNGQATNTAAAGIFRTSPPQAPTSTTPSNDNATLTLVGEYSLATMGAAAGITVPAQSSTQQVFVDRDDGSIWWVAIDLSVPTTYLAHAAAPVGTAAPVLLSCKAFANSNINGFMKDKRGQFWALDKVVGRVAQATVAADGTPTISSTVFYNLGGFTFDQMGYDYATDTMFVTYGDNGADGIVLVMPMGGDYGLNGRPYVRKRLTMTDWWGIEGVYFNGTNLEGLNDYNNHPQAGLDASQLQISGPVTITG